MKKKQTKPAGSQKRRDAKPSSAAGERPQRRSVQPISRVANQKFAGRCGIYGRISTQEGRQHLQNQLGELEAWAKELNLEVVGVWTDEESGTKDGRRGWEEFMGKFTAEAGSKKAWKGKERPEVVLIWDLSRLTRGGPMKAFEYIARLKRHGVEVWSLKEPLFRTAGGFGAARGGVSDNGVGEVFIALAAHVAREENRIRRERILSGVRRAQLAGKKLGRPEVPVDLERLKKLVKEGLSVRAIAEALSCDQTTAYRRIVKLRGAL